MMWSFFTCMACIICMAEFTIIVKRTWHRKASGLAPQTGFTYKGKVRGRLDCSRVCSKLTSTKSYFYNDETSECQCQDLTYSETEFSLQIVPDVQYYEKVHEVYAVDLTNMTTLPCPFDASVATDVIRDGNSLLRFRAFLDTDRSYDDAQAVCVASGGILYKATTLEKFNLAHQLMTQCPVLELMISKNQKINNNTMDVVRGDVSTYATQTLNTSCSEAYMPYTNYWVNGKLNDVTNRFQTSDGELIPMTSYFWNPGMPNDGLKCLWMSAYFVGYKWDDRWCEVHASYPTYAFCELPE